MKNIFLAITTAGILFTACNSSQPEKDASLTAPATEVSTTPANGNAAAQETISNQVQPLPATTTPGAGVITAGLNPEHGQPNHRCDIAVGAPLSSPAPTTQAPANVTTSPAVQPTIPTMPKPILPTSGAVGGKVNPPHGEPGHSCAIAVGAPLP